MAAALCRCQDHGFRVDRGASIRERRMSPPPCALNLRAFRADCPGLSCCFMAFPRVVHRVYRPDYRLLITLPYAALCTRVCRHTGCTLEFRGRWCRRRVWWPDLPYAALPQRRAVPYSDKKRPGTPQTSRVGLSLGRVSGDVTTFWGVHRQDTCSFVAPRESVRCPGG